MNDNTQNTQTIGQPNMQPAQVPPPAQQAGPAPCCPPPAQYAQPVYYPQPAYYQPAYPPRARKLYRSTTNKWLGGVCGGLAEHFNTDATLVRVLWVVMTLASAGVGIVAYIIFWLAVDKDPGYHGTYTQTVTGPDGRSAHHHYHY